ncbi:MAG: DUF882 domain-containing protein [Vampirovibrio sp.]|nr:DUF882 domain-containing protein [Vampirovibrio sp.]
MDKRTRLSPDFRLGEFFSDDDLLPAGGVIENLNRLAQRLQVVRDLLQKPVVITSGYRSPQHNQQIGGVSRSYHTQGMAADIVIPGLAAQEVQQFLLNWSGGLGCYSTHTHVDIRPEKARWHGS